MTGPLPEDAAPAPPAGGDRRFIVAVGESPRAAAAVRACSRIAEAFASSWQAVHVETPEAHRRGSRERAGEALTLATRLGGTVATIPAASVADGLVSQIEEQGATDLLLRRPRGGWPRLFAQPLDEQIAARCPALTVHLTPARPGRRQRVTFKRPQREAAPTMRNYAVALALVAVTALIAVAIAAVAGPRGLDLFFLFPVITVAVRFGLRPGVAAAIASVACHNLFLVRPIFTLDLGSQSLFMAFGLVAVAIYTSVISERLRGRVRLSDRSAKESAAIVTFAQELARAGSWDETARIVCETLSTMLGVRAVLLREKGGKLVVEGAVPAAPIFGPVDEIARDWAWREAEESGRGTLRMAAADWQFLPLKTGLGLLALVGVARENGEAPIPADRAVLLATLTSLASLAHERLRLEDLALERGSPRSSARGSRNRGRQAGDS
jgi:two-component system sensor histidine kinase KdpD